MADLLGDETAAAVTARVLARLDAVERTVEGARAVVAEYRRARDGFASLDAKVQAGENLTAVERARWEVQRTVLEGMEFSVQALAGDT